MIDSLVAFTNELSRYIIPVLLVGIPFYGLAVKKVKVYESFVEGAKDGFTIAVRIIPYLVAILVAIGMFRASGALDILLTILSPFLNAVGFPPENLPLALMRPLSGSGSLGLLTDLIDQHGPNSLISKIGATMFGSTETTFYVLAVYFGSVGIRRSRHALAAGLIADFVGIISAVYICRFLFGISPLSAETIKNNDLVNIQELDSTILVDLKYSTTDNFMNMDMYGNLETCYLRKNPAEMLLRANEYLKATNPELNLLVYDGMRPRSIQQKLWNALDEVPEAERTQYVADPEKGSIHNYGAAVDLTLAHKNGAPLDMGTKYDYFGELAFPALEDSLLSIGLLTVAQIENRKILRNVMTKAGFSTISSEWWHFNAYPYQDIKTKYNIIE
jgi:spore maturation protein B